METTDAKRIVLLLQVIADELYVARIDKEFENASLEPIPGQGPTGPEAWFKMSGRDGMIRGIEKMRDDANRID